MLTPRVGTTMALPESKTAFCFFSSGLLWWQVQVALFYKESRYVESRIHDYGSGWSHPAGR
jgi:hypothetical protein